MDDIANEYDDMRKFYPAGETTMVIRFLRSGQHAARQHRENVAKIVASLFKDTPTDAALVHVKKEVFGVEGGKAIMKDDHPAITALLGLPKGDFCSESN
jgi:predicted GNAT family acetyltransferase